MSFQHNFVPSSLSTPDAGKWDIYTSGMQFIVTFIIEKDIAGAKNQLCKPSQVPCDMYR